jgi:hypothetical protein
MNGAIWLMIVVAEAISGTIRRIGSCLRWAN